MLKVDSKINTNFIISSIILILLWIISLFGDSIELSYFSAIFGCIFTLKYISKFFNGSLNPFKFLSIASATLILTTNLSWLLSGLFVYNSFDINIFNFIDKSLNINHQFYIEAILYTLVFSLILFFFSLSKLLIADEKRLYINIFKAVLIKNKIIYTIIILIIILEILLINSNFITIRSFNQGDYQAGIIRWYIPYLGYIFHFHIAIAALLIVKVNYAKHKNFSYLIIIVSILLLSLIFFTRGRFQFLFTYVELLFWYCLFNKKLPTIKNILIITFIILPFAYYIILFGHYIRLTNEYIGDFKNQSLITTIENAQKYINNSDSTNNIQDDSFKNLSSRTLLNYPLAKSLELEANQKKYLKGKYLINNLIWSIPRFLYPKKVDFLIAEELIVENFDLIFTDTSDSIHLFSYLEFWYFGLIIYPLILFLYWRFLLFIMKINYYNSLTSIFILSPSLLIFFTLAEGGLLGYFSLARDMLIFSMIIVFINKINKTNNLMEKK